MSLLPVGQPSGFVRLREEARGVAVTAATKGDIFCVDDVNVHTTSKTPYEMIQPTTALTKEAWHAVALEDIAAGADGRWCFESEDVLVNVGTNAGVGVKGVATNASHVGTTTCTAGQRRVFRPLVTGTGVIRCRFSGIVTWGQEPA